jgi:hypothetical protein
MKAYLKFDLPEEEEEHKRAVEGWKCHLSLWEFDQFLRTEHKYNDVAVAQSYRDHLREILADNGIVLD